MEQRTGRLSRVRVGERSSRQRAACGLASQLRWGGELARAPAAQVQEAAAVCGEDEEDSPLGLSSGLGKPSDLGLPHFFQNIIF